MCEISLTRARATTSLWTFALSGYALVPRRRERERKKREERKLLGFQTRERAGIFISSLSSFSSPRAENKIPFNPLRGEERESGELALEDTQSVVVCVPLVHANCQLPLCTYGDTMAGDRRFLLAPHVHPPAREPETIVPELSEDEYR